MDCSLNSGIYLQVTMCIVYVGYWNIILTLKCKSSQSIGDVENAGHEDAGLENAAQTCTEWNEL